MRSGRKVDPEVAYGRRQAYCSFFSPEARLCGACTLGFARWFGLHLDRHRWNSVWSSRTHALHGAFAMLPLILCPLLYGIIGSIVTVFGALFYNLASSVVGGLEVDIH